MPSSVIRSCASLRVGLDFQGHRNAPAAVGKFNRIAEQVAYNLRQPGAVAVDPHRHRRRGEIQIALARIDRGLLILEAGANQLDEVQLLALQANLSL